MESAGDDVPAPQTIQEVEDLVVRLYQPGANPQDLIGIQRRLHELQLSDHGWEIANALLGSTNGTSRFFGALTLNIKINSMRDALNDEAKSNLESSVIQWLFTHAANKDNRVVRKLSTTLALFYIHNLDLLGTSVRKLLLTCLGADSSQATQFDLRTVNKNDLSALTPNIVVMVLQYIASVSDESGRVITTITPETYAKLREQYTAAFPDVLFFIHFSLTEYRRQTQDPFNYTIVCDTAMTSLATTAHFTLNWGEQSPENTSGLGACLTASINWCIASLSLDAIEQLVELLSTASRLFSGAQYEVVSELLRSQWGKRSVAELKESPDLTSENSFVPLVLAYGDAQVQTLMNDINDKERGPAAREIIQIMQELLQCQGYPEIEDEVVSRALEFWNLLAEHAEDCIGEGTAGPWLEYAKEQLYLMSQQICVKIKIPVEWDSFSAENKKSLRDFRTDVRDLLQSSYRIIGQPLVQLFSTKAISACSGPDWIEMESSLYCLAALGITSDSTNDTTLSSVFESPIYTILTAESREEAGRTRKTAVDLLGQYTLFFRRNTQFLPSALNFLFSSLQDARTADQASRSIYALCSSCRKELIPEIGNFLGQYETFISQPISTEFAIEKISGAIGVLLQALPSLTEILNGAQTLLTYVRNGMSSAKELIGQGDAENGKMVAGKSMRCLSAIAKSLQAPDIIDLEDDEEQEAPPPTVDEATSQHLQTFQSQIFETLSMTLEVVGDDGEIIDDICNVFKAGFTEPTNSPFHFAPDIVVQFFSISSLTTAHLESILRMGCSFLRSQKHQEHSSGTVIARLAEHLASLVESLGEPRADITIAQSLIEMLTRFMPDFINAILQLQPVSKVEKVLGFTIKAIELPDPLPKRSALSFWNSFLDLPPTPLLDQVIVHYGPLLSSAFIRQLSGNATRTDIDHFVGPVKKLIRRHVHAKPWLEDALTREVPGSSDAYDAAKKRFVTQLGMTNTIRGSKDIMLAFWNACRGVSASYTPLRGVAG